MTINSTHYLDQIVKAQKRGEARGITSICSAHPFVLESVFRHPRKNGSQVLIKLTCNQVNQFGGYTGMTPASFVTYVRGLAEKADFPLERLILGGDHLGPNVWMREFTDRAMAKSYQLVKDYVAAGYTKIHLDASMKLGDDPGGSLPTDTIARRAAEMAKVAEQSFIESGSRNAPRYVIGTEVPIPGGAQHEEEGLQVSTVQDTQEMLEITRRAFYDLGLEPAWERVIAVVVQPGVEFGVDFIIDYDRAMATELSEYIEGQPLIYEAHSTDYQLPQALRQMVEDHFAILKVGPALTFVLREVIFGFALIENALFPVEARSNIIEVLDKAMLDQPGYWQDHYRGSSRAQALARKYSFSDRSRYYWPLPEVQAALKVLLENLSEDPIPLTLLSQYLPEPYNSIRSGWIPNNCRAIIRNNLFSLLDGYWAAAGEQ